MVRLLLILSIGLALCACVHQTGIQFPSNMSAMPVVDASFYDNPVAPAAQNSAHPAAQTMESVTARAVADGIPGVVLLFSTPENGTWVSAKGSIDLKNGAPMKPNSLSRIGSITKMFTAVILHMLVQEGKLLLDDPTSKYLADDALHGISNADGVTIRQLLGHTSGIANYTDHFDIPALYKSGTNKDLTSAKALDLVRGLPAAFVPGASCTYSNTNYILLGLIAEKVTGKTMKDLYQQRIFCPLGLRGTYYDPDAPVQRGVARGYVELPSGNLIDTTDFDQGARTPDGGIVSNVYDMAAFIQALVQDRRLLSETEYAQMTGDLRRDARLGCDDGLGILVDRLPDGDLVYGHSGGHFGYAAELWCVPSKKLTLAYLANGSSEFGAHVRPLADLKSRSIAMLVDYPRGR